MSYQILNKREVPVSEKNITLTGKIVTTTFANGGSKAVYVRLESGFSAWGFGPTWESAEENAVTTALSY